MALSHAILVTLLDRPHSGYEISKRFDKTVGFFWRARKQQIYSELHKLAEDGLISAEIIEQIERPNRIVYSITADGRKALDHWVREPTPYPSVKEELLVKLFSLGDVETAVLVDQVGQRLAEHRERLAYFHALMKTHYPKPATLTGRKLGHYLGLRCGVLNEESGIAWCTEALGLLETRRRPAAR
ncbi:PadR family transcriptional regulator [Solimonas terrae]|uniref:PadR family transcriptional regulator n=1 Tax=Solimonas terrae TaxID=1396819 RepID=A0A6M2BP17_9GAMM|nr:PadR family transcriptional regulator [Solimonas terrae]NGY04356.1 PadR family transcriptional regulator [Solimonas terrae]